MSFSINKLNRLKMKHIKGLIFLLTLPFELVQMKIEHSKMIKEDKRKSYEYHH